MLSTLRESVAQTTCVFILRSTYTTDVSSYPPRKKKRSRILSVLRESVAQMGGPGSGRLKLNASIEIDMLPPPIGALPLELKARPVTSILQSQLDWELVSFPTSFYYY